jgi:uncharacterized membrane protein YraQ (UPF0718 family)
MESWALVIALLAAVLVGALVPVLVQLRATLRAVEQATRASGGRLEEALRTTSAAAHQIDAVITRLTSSGQVEKLVEKLVDDVSALSRLAGQVGDVVRVASAVGAAVGPAFAAGARALRADPPPVPRPFDHANFKHVHQQSRKQARS